MAASLIFFGMLAATFAWQVEQNLETDIAALRLPLPHREIVEQDWWEDDWETLPRERTDLKSVAARAFNLQYAGNLKDLSQLLAVHGWVAAEPANWSWAILSMNPEPTEMTLPPLKRDYLGHADNLLLHKTGGVPTIQETIRLWDSGVRLKPEGQTVYLGQLGSEVLVQRLKIFSYWSAIPAQQTDLEHLAKEFAVMQTKRADELMILIRGSGAPGNGAVTQAAVVTAPTDR
jgi:hypothetical protein